MFDYSLQAKTIEALAKLHARNVSVTEDAIRSELGFAYPSSFISILYFYLRIFSEREWIRFGKDIMELIEGIPNTSSPSFKRTLVLVTFSFIFLTYLFN